MTSLSGNPAAGFVPRWFHVVLLAALIALSGWIRLDRLDRESLTLDEYWALYLATGRGDQVFQIPYGVIVSSPPNVGYQNAPAWWHIWTGLDSTTHPPLYHLMLRAGSICSAKAIFATRILSLVFRPGRHSHSFRRSPPRRRAVAR